MAEWERKETQNDFSNNSFFRSRNVMVHCFFIFMPTPRKNVPKFNLNSQSQMVQESDTSSLSFSSVPSLTVCATHLIRSGAACIFDTGARKETRGECEGCVGSIDCGTCFQKQQGNHRHVHRTWHGGDYPAVYENEKAMSSCFLFSCFTKWAVLKKKMKTQFGWFITNVTYESNNPAMTLKWKSISANAF